MVCKFCGGALSDDTILCPYCGWENETLAAKERETEITEVMDKTHEYMHKPAREAKKATKVFLLVLAGVLVLLAMLIMMATCTNRIKAEEEYRAQKEALIELERLYTAGDYSAMNAYLRDVPDWFSSTYVKYRSVGDLYRSINRLEEHCPSTVKVVVNNPDKSYFLISDLEDLFGLIRACKDMEEAGYIFGEEETVTDYSARAKTILKDVFLLTDDEIQSGIEISKSEEPDYTELSDLSLERLTGGNE